MILNSTRNSSEKKTFGEAIFIGLAPDGGLYYPSESFDLSSILRTMDERTSFNTMASAITGEILKDELCKDDAEKIVNQAFYFTPELHRLNDNLSILELFHGGTSAFKDFGASFLASAMEHFLKDNKATILTATSGDTGSAVAKAFHNKKNIDVVILYPSGRVSPLQEKQLTTLGSNIHALEVKGSFDDCQRIVKEAFSDSDLKEKFHLTSANSINIGRLLPQSFYYFWSYLQLKSEFPLPVFTVPSGNFGNLTAALYAKSWGLPVKKFIAATNSNDIVPKYLDLGVYEPKASIHTYSNAMDVGAPSNFERMKTLYNDDVTRFRKEIIGVSVSDEITAETMKEVYKTYKYMACPHTAVGIKASMDYLQDHPSDKVISLSTAHPGKFLEVSEEILGISPDLPDSLSTLKDKKKMAQLVDNNLEDLVSFLSKNF